MMSQYSVSKSQAAQPLGLTVDTFKDSNTATALGKGGSVSHRLAATTVGSTEKNDLASTENAFKPVTEWQLEAGTERSEVEQSFIITDNQLVPQGEHDTSKSITEQQVLQSQMVQMVTFNQDRGPCPEQRPQKLRQNEDIQDYLFNAAEPAFNPAKKAKI